MNKRTHLFCYVLPEGLNSEIEYICDSNRISQADFVRECLHIATRNKTNSKKVKKAASNGGRKINDTQKKKLIYLSPGEYQKLLDLREGTQISLASILRMGIEINKDRVAQKAIKSGRS